jgi:GDPmannose 4,6-dehydratase
VNPDEVYDLETQSQAWVSFEPEHTADTTGSGTVRMLKRSVWPTSNYASTRRLRRSSTGPPRPPQNEGTPFHNPIDMRRGEARQLLDHPELP